MVSDIEFQLTETRMRARCYIYRLPRLSANKGKQDIVDLRLLPFFTNKQENNEPFLDAAGDVRWAFFLPDRDMNPDWVKQRPAPRPHTPHTAPEAAMRNTIQ